ncbi:WW domain-containing protein [Entamoeba marina]
MCDPKVTIIQGGQVIGEDVIGYVTVHPKHSIFIKGITVSMKGKYQTITKDSYHTTYKLSNGRSSVKHATVEKNTKIKEVFYQSEETQILDDLTQNTFQSLEIPPVEYRIPFKYTLPNNQPTSISMKYGEVFVKYLLCFKVIDINGGCTKINKPIPYNIQSKQHTAHPIKITEENDVASATVSISDDHPTVGDDLIFNIKCTSKCEEYLTGKVTVFTSHTFQGQVVCVRSETEYIENVPPFETASINQGIKIPIAFPTTITTNINKNFIVKSYCTFHLWVGAHTFSMKIPITIGCDVPQNKMKERVKAFDYDGIFNKQIISYGAHFRPPPSYQDVCKNFNNGVEMVKINDRTYYINHLTRTTSTTSDSQTDCEYPYPLYSSTILPDGWSLGKIFGEKYFIDHENKKTTWEDPRKQKQGLIPHIQKNTKNSKLVIQVFKAVGLCVLNKNIPDPYVRVRLDEKSWNQTDSYKDQLDIAFNKNNVFEIPLSETRSNVIVYVFDKYKIGSDVFMGGVDINLMYFPQDVIIEDWFPLSCFGDKSKAITGKLYMSVYYKVNDAVQPITQKINGYSSLDIPYYPKTSIMDTQLEKQRKVREKYKMANPPMILLDGLVVCKQEA